MTFKQCLLRSIGPALLFGVFVYFTSVGTVTAERVEPEPYVEVLINSHDCWTDDVPAKYKGEIPTAIVYTIGSHSFYSEEMTDVDRGMRDVFEKDDPRFTVNAFCMAPLNV